MRRMISAVAAVALFALPAAAHHGWGSYEATTPMTIEGAITGLKLQNPHGEMTVEHDGAPWLITLAPLSRMTARGATADIVKDGVTVKAYGYPRRDGTKEIRAEWIEIGDQHFELR
jgi:hypothetical protein